MSFDWEKFRELAEELRQGETEAARRTAISRIYYAVYHRAKTYLENEGFQFRQFESSHRQIWDEFKDKGRTFAAIGNTGDRLRANRVKADYIAEIADIDLLVERSFELAENAFTYLKQIEKK
ncbi:MAG: hypothetical protein M3Q99_15320 [Acidobacteriota bacterium]|nr:hypothetical protein [Acidobacteriota bacterium]